jgi:hypothetical protein
MRNVIVNTGTTEEFFAGVRETAKHLIAVKFPNRSSLLRSKIWMICLLLVPGNVVIPAGGML